MKRSAAFFPIALALGAIIFVPRGAAQAQDGREEGPIEIEKCRTIDKPGSYKLVNNLSLTGPVSGTCLSISASFVTIDLAGFAITTNLETSGPNFATGIGAQPSSANLHGIAVRNGSISGFGFGVALSSADGSVVEGLRVFGALYPTVTGIDVNGIVRGNTVVDFSGEPGIEALGISASGIVTGNSVVSGARAAGMAIGPGSTVIGNTATSPRGVSNWFRHICDLSL